MFLLEKLLFLLIIIIVCFLGGVGPILLRRFCNKSGNIISFSSCLGAGILLGASFLHLLKDSEELLNGEYPYSHLIYAFGFFTSFILERVLVEHEHNHDIPTTTSSTLDNQQQELKEHKHFESITTNDQTIISLYASSSDDTNNIINNSEILTTTISNENENNQEKEGLVTNEINFDENGNIIKKHHHHHGNNKHHHHHHHNHNEINNSGKFPYMLFIVLSLESFISGMALTIEDDMVLIFVTFLAIITHIWAESFALSANIMKSLSVIEDSNYISKTIYKSSFIFSLVTPIGGIFGLISEYILKQETINQISGILLAFAGGCFLYVGIFEIMVEEFSNHNHGHNHNSHSSHEDKNKIILKFKKLFLLFVGFTFMAIIAKVV